MHAKFIIDKIHLHLLLSMNYPDGFVVESGPLKTNAHMNLNRDFIDHAEEGQMTFSM